MEHALGAELGNVSCPCDRISPLCGSFGTEDPRGRPEDEWRSKLTVL